MNKQTFHKKIADSFQGLGGTVDLIEHLLNQNPDSYQLLDRQELGILKSRISSIEKTFRHYRRLESEYQR